jgi:hypothetical protein
VTQPNTTQITVSYDRNFSDGNYGSEGLSLTYTATYEIAEDLAIDESMISARCQSLTRNLREAVLGELAHSGAERVAFMARRELDPPPPRQPVTAAAARSDDLEETPF